MLLAPSAALAWFPFQPALPEEAAREIAFQNGVVMIDDVSRTVDADWEVEGHDGFGNKIEMIIDGQTGAIESAEMETN
jgi:hypothetical protein